MMEAGNAAVCADLSRRTLDLLRIPRERRGSHRLRLTVPLPACLGRTDGVLIDLGRRGARFHHEKALAPGVELRLTFEWPGGPFRVRARVLSSRLIAVGSRQTRFESRLQFLQVPPGSNAVLQRVITTLTDQQLRQWVANMMGEWQVPPSAEPAGTARARLRFRLLNGHWDTQPAAAGEGPPPDGFIVPASMEPGEISILCAAYQSLDRDGRQLLRLFASAALEG